MSLLCFPRLCSNVLLCLSVLNPQCLLFLQVKLIEGVILAINLIAAVWIGSWMMHNLGTPTRFETPKEGVQRE